MSGKLLTLEQIKRFVRGVYGNKQDRITGTPKDILTIGDDGLLSSVSRDKISPVIPRKNLLINSRFTDLINQLGEQTYVGSTNSTLCVDGWALKQGQLSLTSDKKRISLLENFNSTISVPVFSQWVPNAYLYAGQYLTFSFLVDEFVSSMSAPFTTLGLSATIPSKLDVTLETSKWMADPGLVSFTFKVPEAVTANDNLTVDVILSKAGACVPKSAKLEVGTDQTLAYQDENGGWIEYEPYGDHANEWLRCCEQMVFMDGMCFCCSNGNGDNLDISTSLPVPMVKKPSVTLKYIENVYINGSVYSTSDVSTAILISGSDNKTYAVRINPAVSLPSKTAGQVGRLAVVFNATPFIIA